MRCNEKRATMEESERRKRRPRWYQALAEHNPKVCNLLFIHFLFMKPFVVGLHGVLLHFTTKLR